MEIEKLKEKILSLPATERERLLREVGDTLHTADLAAHATLRHELDNKIGNCPHCSHNKYVRYGRDNGCSATSASPATGASRSTPALGWPASRGG